MALTLNRIESRQGLAWIVDGGRQFRKRPLGFVGLFAGFMVGAAIVDAIPLVGNLVVVAAFPLLTLASMIATRSVAAGGQVPLNALFRTLLPQVSRRAMLAMCALYAAIWIGILAISGWLDGGASEEIARILRSEHPGAEELRVAMSDPRLLQAMLTFMVLASLQSIPFWFAPALLFWGRQSTMQALFSSTLALWRNRGAFSVYVAGWIGVSFGLQAMSLMFSTLLAASGFGAGIALMPFLLASLLLFAWFYATLWFSFIDIFGLPASETSA